MKKDDTHPKYSSEVMATCACGAKFKVGSTKDAIETEICSDCHPFFTGKQKIVDSAGRVEKFKARQAKAVKKAPKEEEVVEETPEVAEETPTEETPAEEVAEEKAPEAEATEEAETPAEEEAPETAEETTEEEAAEEEPKEAA